MPSVTIFIIIVFVVAADVIRRVITFVAGELTTVFRRTHLQITSFMTMSASHRLLRITISEASLASETYAFAPSSPFLLKFALPKTLTDKEMGHHAVSVSSTVMAILYATSILVTVAKITFSFITSHTFETKNTHLEILIRPLTKYNTTNIVERIPIFRTMEGNTRVPYIATNILSTKPFT